LCFYLPSAAYLKLIMMGVQTHIQSPLPAVRHTGMAVGEVLMNSLHETPSDPDSEHKALDFEYPAGPATEAIKKLGRPVAEQERELQGGRRGVEGGEKEAAGSVGDTGGKTVVGDTKQDPGIGGERERFGEGYARAVDCSDSDSDDDLVPYAMDDDPDASQMAAPRYLRILMQGKGRGGLGYGGVEEEME
jgi:hypothetical protein